MKSWFEKSFEYRKKIHPVLVHMPLYDYWMLFRHSYLAKKGWFKSFKSGRSVDANGKPIPWFVYNAIDFLEETLPAHAKVFEFGSGYSTEWWGARVSLVHSVEHNQEWKDKMQPLLPNNVTVFHKNLGEGYETAVLTKGRTYDVIILDGRNRDKCLGPSLQSLSEGGVLIFDDSHWEKYQITIDYIRSLGFRQLPFRGMSPIEFLECETSIFYRDGNILGI